MNMKYLLILLLLINLTSCSTEEYKESLDSERFYGKEITLKSDIIAHGITLSTNYSGDVDYVVLMPEPGFNGPEVKFRKLIRSGVDFIITGKYFKKSMFGYDYYFLVTSRNEIGINNWKIFIKYEKNRENKNLGLDISTYKENKNQYN
ncbi:hypothetical protein [Idiomarina xiamenensis]|nr:hypothetical protein [Idiomarina xiamenensis]